MLKPVKYGLMKNVRKLLCPDLILIKKLKEVTGNKQNIKT